MAQKHQPAFYVGGVIGGLGVMTALVGGAMLAFCAYTRSQLDQPSVTNGASPVEVQKVVEGLPVLKQNGMIYLAVGLGAIFVGFMIAKEDGSERKSTSTPRQPMLLWLCGLAAAALGLYVMFGDALGFGGPTDVQIQSDVEAGIRNDMAVRSFSCAAMAPAWQSLAVLTPRSQRSGGIVSGTATFNGSINVLFQGMRPCTGTVSFRYIQTSEGWRFEGVKLIH